MLEKIKELSKAPITPKDVMIEGGRVLKAAAEEYFFQSIEVIQSAGKLVRTMREAMHQLQSPIKNVKALANDIGDLTYHSINAVLQPSIKGYNETRKACDRLLKKR